DPVPRREALLAALEAGAAVEDFKQRHDMPNANLRIGLEAGWVYIGHAGGGGRFVYSIVGDSANTASRVEGLNKHIGTQILATGAVVEGFENVLTRYLGDFQFVNKTDAVPIYHVVALNEHATPQQQELCERFDAAMEKYRARDWHDAEARLEQLLIAFPADGPAKFFLQRCKRYAAEPDESIDPRLVKMDAK
ncbi:MAG: adenylate/guanylate cyclase domain-containing protein, partial [Gammaproteobacteria bacterium]